jgi:hypothetical protein
MASENGTSGTNGMKKVQDPVGSRLVLTQVAYYALEEPSRVYGMMPVDDADLTKGFRDVTYQELASAVQKAASWLDDHLPAAGSAFEYVSYVVEHVCY